MANQMMTPANIYLLKANNSNTTKSCICSNLTIKTPERHQWRRSGVFIVNFEHILQLFAGLLFVDFEQVNVSWTARKWKYTLRIKTINQTINATLAEMTETNVANLLRFEEPCKQ